MQIIRNQAVVAGNAMNIAVAIVERLFGTFKLYMIR